MMNGSPMMRSLAVLLVLAAAAPSAAQQLTADSTRVYDLTEVEVLPRPQNVSDFTAALGRGYPAHLRASGVGGTVQVAFVVSPAGEPSDVRVLSTPDSGFSVPTVQAVSLLRFTPAQVQGRPVAVRVEQPITWRVEAAPAAAQAPVLPDSIHVYAVEEADVRPLPLNFRDFEAALRALYAREFQSTGAAQVVARFAVDPSGAPRYAHVVRSSDVRFDAPSLVAVGMLRFQPAQREGAPVWVWMEVPVEWAKPAERAPAASPDSMGAYELSAVEVLPRALNSEVFGRALAREYPPALRDIGAEGTVQVRFLVDEHGVPHNPIVTHATNTRFIEPTLTAVQVLRFRPARLNGRPVRVWVEQPIQWTVSRERPVEWTAPRYEPDRGNFSLPRPCSVQC
jgi:TonB family protein